MNEILIARWNEVVKKGDTVYHLGDLTFKGDPTPFVEKLNGQIHLIKGNHDKIKKSMLLNDLFVTVSDIKVVKTFDIPIVLCHYKMCVWPNSHHGSWHLYGHSHGASNEDNKMRSFDVGVDTHNFYPYSYEEVVEKMNTKILKQGIE